MQNYSRRNKINRVKGFLKHRKCHKCFTADMKDISKKKKCVLIHR